MATNDFFTSSAGNEVYNEPESMCATRSESAHECDALNPWTNTPSKATRRQVDGARRYDEGPRADLIRHILDKLRGETEGKGSEEEQDLVVALFLEHYDRAPDGRSAIPKGMEDGLKFFYRWRSEVLQRRHTSDATPLIKDVVPNRREFALRVAKTFPEESPRLLGAEAPPVHHRVRFGNSGAGLGSMPENDKSRNTIVAGPSGKWTPPMVAGDDHGEDLSADRPSVVGPLAPHGLYSNSFSAEPSVKELRGFDDMLPSLVSGPASASHRDANVGESQTSGLSSEQVDVRDECDNGRNVFIGPLATAAVRSTKNPDVEEGGCEAIETVTHDAVGLTTTEECVQQAHGAMRIDPVDRGVQTGDRNAQPTANGVELVKHQRDSEGFAHPKERDTDIRVIDGRTGKTLRCDASSAPAVSPYKNLVCSLVDTPFTSLLGCIGVAAFAYFLCTCLSKERL